MLQATTPHDNNATLLNEVNSTQKPNTIPPSIIQHITPLPKKSIKKVEALKLTLLEHTTNRNTNSSIMHDINHYYEKLQSKSKTPLVAKPQEKKPFKDFKDWFDVTLRFNSSLQNLTRRDATRETFDIGLSFSPLSHLYFTTTLMLDTNGFKDSDYQPNFYYTFGYDSYTLDSWGFSYSNYENNRFNADEKSAGFGDGTWEIHYRTKWQEFLLVPKIKHIPNKDFTFVSLWGYRQIGDKSSFSFDYDKSLHYNQHKLQLSMKSFVYDKFFVAGSIFLYSDWGLQEDYESDYSFSLGWADSRKGKFSIIYSNEYMKTRWPWRDEGGISPFEGKISISYNF